MKRYVLIVGGELRNMGAQAMVFRTVASIKSLLPGFEPVLVSGRDAPPDFFDRLIGRRARDDANNLAFSVAKLGLASNSDLPTTDWRRDLGLAFMAKETAKTVLRQITFKKFAQIVDDAALCLDISGFALGSQRGYQTCQRYLDRIEALRSREIPLYLLPQSFGPFEFSDELQTKSVKKRAADLLSYPRIVFARETSGLHEVLCTCPHARCELSEDLVLQGGDVPLEAVFRNVSLIPTYRSITKERNVGIVPNAQTFAHGNEVEVYALWHIIIEDVLKTGHNVYIIRHSEDDERCCSKIKAMFAEDSRVMLLDENRYCFQYEELFSRCDFLVASRFHSVVHAFRRGTPCVVIGWAAKYDELLARFGQHEFAHDVRSLNDDSILAVLQSVRKMSGDFKSNAEIIRTKLVDIQSADNAFKRVADDFKGLKQ